MKNHYFWSAFRVLVLILIPPITKSSTTTSKSMVLILPLSSFLVPSSQNRVVLCGNVHCRKVREPSFNSQSYCGQHSLFNVQYFQVFVLNAFTSIPQARMLLLLRFLSASNCSTNSTMLHLHKPKPLSDWTGRFSSRILPNPNLITTIFSLKYQTPWTTAIPYYFPYPLDLTYTCIL